MDQFINASDNEAKSQRREFCGYCVHGLGSSEYPEQLSGTVNPAGVLQSRRCCWLPKGNVFGVTSPIVGYFGSSFLEYPEMNGFLYAIT